MLSEEEQCTLDIEIQSLKAIYSEELQVNRAEDDGGPVKSLVVKISPESSKGEGLQFVRFEIELEIPQNYPQALPKIMLKNVRGLSEEAQARTKEHMMNRAEELSGNAMLFELIQVAKELLTSDNAPSIPCSICLFSFDTEDKFSRTPCFHFFHTHCLAKHVQHTFAEKHSPEDKGMLTEMSKDNAQQEVLCPVCRLAIPFKECDPEQFPVPRESLKDEGEIVITPELREMQQKMADLFSQQLARGSIINLEAEKNKFFIEISNTPDIPVLSSSAVSPNLARQSNDTSTTGDNTASKANSASTADSTANSSGKLRNYYKSRNYDKRSVQGPAKRPTWNTGQSTGSKVDAVDNWGVDEDKPDRSAPEAELPADGDDNMRRDGIDEKKGRRRNQFTERKQRYRKEIPNEVQEGEDGAKMVGEANQGDESTHPYRNIKRNKFKKPRNTDTSTSNQDETSNAEESSSKNKNVDECAEQLQDMSLNNKTKSEDNQFGRASRNKKFNVRPSGHNNYNNEGQQRNVRRNNYNNGRRYTKRFSTDGETRAQDDENVVEQDGDQIKAGNSEGVEDPAPRNQSGGYHNNRYRNSYYKNYGRNKPRDYRNAKMPEGSAHQDQAEGQVVNEDSEEQSVNVMTKRQNTANTFRRPRVDSKQMFGVGKDCSEDVGDRNLESPDAATQNRSQEGWDGTQGEARSNRRFQKSYSRESDSSEAQKNVDSFFRGRYGDHKPRYRNRQDNFRKQQTPFLDKDKANEDLNMAAQEPQSSDTRETDGTHDDGVQDQSRYNNRENINRQIKSRPRYARNRDLVNERSGNDDVYQQEAAPQSHPSEQSSEVQRDYQYNRNRFNTRTNRNDDANSNQNWKGRNRYYKYGQRYSPGSASQTKPDVLTASSRTDPSPMKQNIRPFTLFSSATSEAQPLVSIPPPF